jgi:predicted metal-dependent RNase
MAGSKPRVVVCHGEDKARTVFAGLLREQYGVETTLPALGDSVSL